MALQVQEHNISKLTFLTMLQTITRLTPPHTHIHTNPVQQLKKELAQTARERCGLGLGRETHLCLK